MLTASYLTETILPPQVPMERHAAGRESGVKGVHHAAVIESTCHSNT